MSSRVALLTLADGSLAVMHFPGGHEPSPALLAQEIAKSGLSVSSSRTALLSSLPTTRRFRGAWQDDGANVVHDMVKARLIYKDEVTKGGKGNANDSRINQANTISDLIALDSADSPDVPPENTSPAQDDSTSKESPAAAPAKRSFFQALLDIL